MMMEKSYHQAGTASGAVLGNGAKSPSSNCLQGLFEQALSINERISAVNEKMYRDVSRIGGSWPVNSLDTECGPDTDGMISAIQAVLSRISRQVGETENIASQLSSI